MPLDSDLISLAFEMLGQPALHFHHLFCTAMSSSGPFIDWCTSSLGTKEKSIKTFCQGAPDEYSHWKQSFNLTVIYWTKYCENWPVCCDGIRKKFLIPDISLRCCLFVSRFVIFHHCSKLRILHQDMWHLRNPSMCWYLSFTYWRSANTDNLILVMTWLSLDFYVKGAWTPWLYIFNECCCQKLRIMYVGQLE